MFDLWWEENTPFGKMTHKWMGTYVKHSHKSAWVRFWHELDSTNADEFFRQKKVLKVKPIACMEETECPQSSTRHWNEECDLKLAKKKTRPEPDSEESNIVGKIVEAFDNKDAGGGWETLVDGVKVPLHPDNKFKLFFPHLWIGGSNEQHAQWENLYREFFLHYAVGFRTPGKIEEHAFFKRTFEQYCFYNYKLSTKEGDAEIGLQLNQPMTKEEWRPLYYAAAYFFGSCALGSEVARKDAQEEVIKNFEDSGKVDFKKLWLKNEKPKEAHPADESVMQRRIQVLEKELAASNAASVPMQTAAVAVPMRARGGSRGGGYGRGRQQYVLLPPPQEYGRRGGRGGRLVW